MQKNFYEKLGTSEFDLKKLVQFNPALVYGFEREASLLAERQDESKVECYIHFAGQYQDMYNAYLYAQEVIIPTIEKMGRDKITPDMVLHWLDQIHLRIAVMLAQDHADAKVGGAVAGEPCKRQIVRWRHGVEVELHLKRYLSDRLPVNVDIVAIMATYGIPITTARKFIRLLSKIQKDQTIEIPEYERIHFDMNASNIKGQIILTKLIAGYHSKKLNPEERDCVSEIIIVCVPPSEFPKLRQQFAQEFVARLKVLNPKDTKAVGEFVFFIFLRVTAGHWWFNCNGRAATCFLNAILRALGKPSILVRNPTEKYQSSSSYKRGIDLIEKQPHIMQKHLTDRIAETEKGNFYKNEKEQSLLILKMQLCKLMTRIKGQFPEYNLDNFFTVIQRAQHRKLAASGITDNDQQILTLLNGYLSAFDILLEKLIKGKAESFITPLSSTAATTEAQTANKEESAFLHHPSTK